MVSLTCICKRTKIKLPAEVPEWLLPQSHDEALEEVFAQSDANIQSLLKFDAHESKEMELLK